MVKISLHICGEINIVDENVVEEWKEQNMVKNKERVELESNRELYL